MKPSWSAVNLTPTLTAALSDCDGVGGVTVDAQIVHGQALGATVTATPLPGVSRLPLSSTARLLIVTLPVLDGVQLYVQLARPLAGCHVVPPSVDTSMPPTTPPPESLAVPVIVTATFACRLAPADGAVMTEVGAAISLDADAATRPVCRFAGCALRSAKRLTVACCILTSTGA